MHLNTLSYKGLTSLRVGSHKVNFSFLILCFAILIKLILCWICLKNGTDRMLFISEAKNLLSGHGLTIDRSFFDDIAQKRYLGFTGAPPLYALLISVPLYFFPDNPMLACFLIDTVAVVIFFIYLSKLLSVLGFSAGQVNMFILFQGLYLQEYILASGPTDFIAISFLIAGWYHSCLVVKDNSKTTSLFIAAIFLLLSIFTRYQYLPVIFLSAFTLFFIGYKNKDAALKKRSTWFFSAACIIIFSFFLFQKTIIGSYYYVASLNTGWYPDNLPLTYPFSILSLINHNFWSSKISSFTNTEFLTINNLFYYSAIAFLILLLFYLWQYLKSIVKKKNIDLQNGSWFIGLTITSGVVIFLAILSLFTNRHLTAYEWTYVMEARYFAFPVLFIQLIIFKWLTIPGRVFKKFRIFISVIIIIAWSIECIHGITYTSKKSYSNFPAPKNIFLQDQIAVLVKEFTEKNKAGSRIPAVFGHPNLNAYLSNWYGGNGVFMLDRFEDILPKASKPVTLMIILPQHLTYKFSKLIQTAELKYRLQDILIFTVNVGP